MYLACRINLVSFFQVVLLQAIGAIVSLSGSYLSSPYITIVFIFALYLQFSVSNKKVPFGLFTCLAIIPFIVLAVWLAQSANDGRP
jgi:hypothetical protein